jgi:hypothetical protein
MDDAKSRECAAWVAAQIKGAEQGRAELVADNVRRKEELRAATENIRYTEPRYTATRSPSPENSVETPEFLTATEAAAVRQFVATNSADMEAPKILYSARVVSEPATIRKSDSDMTGAANAQQWEMWLATRLEAEQRLVLEAVGEAIGKLLDEETKHHEAARDKLRDKLRDVEIALANTKADVSNLRMLLLTNGKP